VELCFSAYFLAELVIRLVACRSMRKFSQSVWNVVDALCVLGSIVDLVIVPVASSVIHGVGVEDSASALTALRVLRLFKILRIFRLSRVSSEVNLFIRSLWSGLQETSIVWAILSGLVFTFSVLLMTYATDEMREANFSSLNICMSRLVSSGILLDDVGSLFDDMRTSSDVISYVAFLFFVVITQFIILNMLIGIMCSVAVEARADEKECAKTLSLRLKFQNEVECYMQEDGTISRRDFRLIIKNADVHKVLKQCGSSIEYLASMEESLYAQGDYTDLTSLFEAIMHSNEGKHATVKDIFQTQNVLNKSLHSIECQLAGMRNPP